MKHTSIFVIVSLGISSLASALILKNEVPVEAANLAMKKSGHTETVLEMATLEKNQSLRFWNLDQGVLIARYSTDSGKILALSFYLCDERAKAERQNFNFEVISFDTENGNLILKTAKKAKVGGGKSAPSDF